MKESNKFWNNNYTWIISSIIVLIFMIVFMLIFKVTPFGTNTFVNSDCYVQMYPMLAHLHDILNGEGSFFYSWNNGLGGDFLPTYFYYIASPVYLLVGLIDKNNLLSFISITIALKAVLSAGTFAFYLSRRNGDIDNNVFYIALSCAYALSNYMCGYYYQIMWFDALVVFPLILLGFVKLRSNKPILYVITLSYSLYVNYYITYIVCLFLILLFLLDSYSTLKDFFIRGLRFACYSFLAAGMSAVSLLISYIGLTKTVSYTDKGISHSWYGNIFTILRQHFLFSNTVVSTPTENDANIYCGSFILFFVLLYMFNNRFSLLEKMKRVLLLVILLLSMNESVLNYIWHGFHVQHSVPNRFSIVYIVFLLVISADAKKYIYDNSSKSIVCSALISFVFPFICYFFTDFNSIFTSHQILYVSIVVILIYSCCVFSIHHFKANKMKIVVDYFFTALIVVELIINALVSIKLNLNNSTADRIVYDCVENAKEENEKNEKAIFYRSDFSSIDYNNSNLYHNMYGVGAFESTLNVKFVAFLESMGEQTSKNRIMYSQMKNYMDDILGIKYIYCIDGCRDYEYDQNYKRINSIDGINIYKNIDALSVGFGVNDNIQLYDNQFDYLVSNNISSFLYGLSGTDGALQHIIPEYNLNVDNCEIRFGDTDFLCFKYEDYDDNTAKKINVDFDIPDDGVYFLDVRESNQDLLTIKVNNELYKEGIWLINGMNILGHLSQNDHISVEISDNNEHIYSNISPESELQFFVYKLDMIKTQEIVDYLSKNQMKINDFNHNSLSGTITLDDDQVLFTSIPYDKGWHIYEDGKRIKAMKVADVFLGADLGKGTHELTFIFIPEGLYLGLVISIISWIIFVLVTVFNQKKRQKEINILSEGNDEKNKTT